MAAKIAQWVLVWRTNPIIVIFKDFGFKFRYKGQKHYWLSKKRDEFIAAFSKQQIAIRTIIDTTNIPYNGCKTKKIRRRKKKHIIKTPPIEK